ncbi:MAG: hypothetical protein L0H74_04545 [Brachybacterium sp.]|nr:hypothetical protein [Brachybacterium sp.]
MSSAKFASVESSRPIDESFAALLQVVQGREYELAGLSNETHQMLFKSGKTALSWGHYYMASGIGTAQGSTLNLTIAGVPGAPTSLLDGRKNKKAGEKLVEAVETVLASAEGPSPQLVESFAVLEDGSSVPWTEGEYPGA